MNEKETQQTFTNSEENENGEVFVSQEYQDFKDAVAAFESDKQKNKNKISVLPNNIWQPLKKLETEINKIPKRGEIWLIDYNYKPKNGKERELEIASYLKKTRPSLVVSNNVQNEFDEEIIVVPLNVRKITL